MNKLDALGVVVNTGVNAIEIESSTVKILMAGNESRIPVDNVVLAGSTSTNSEAFESLNDSTQEVHFIGDCTGVGLIVKATSEAMRAASSL